jgi:anti-anti-sigma regulatory factor
MTASDELRTAFLSALDELERTLGSEAQAGLIARVRDAGFDVLDDHSANLGLLEARDAQIAAQVELLTRSELPLLQVSRTTLCIPLIGEFDSFRTAQIIHGLLEAAVARRVTTVVIDLTGALFRDISTAIDLARVFQSLRMIGVRAVLSGVQPGLAPWLAANDEPLRGVPCFADLADALAHEGRTRT